MALINSRTLRKTPRRMRRSVISRRNRSTRLSQDEEVGMKWMWKRGLRTSHFLKSKSIGKSKTDF